MTNQQAFNKVRKHLLKQDQRAEADGICRYRVPGTKLRCAAGALITDAKYTPEMEGKMIERVAKKWPGALPKDVDLDLVTSLQHVHDHTLPDQWPSWLAKVAWQFGLEVQGG
jgi:hypothetical protein